MANDLMDASLLDTGRMHVALERLELGRLLADVVERVPLAAPQTRLELPAGVQLFIKGDAQRLEQVIANLLSNAVKYGTPDSEVGLALTYTDHDVDIVVSNHGPGIPADELPFVFDRYSRSRAAQSGTTAGLGLGLNIAKGLVAAHAGRIWAESVPDGITSFHITLPLDGPPLAVDAAAHARPPKAERGARRG
jgi:signal transduction histidine kinase